MRKEDFIEWITRRPFLPFAIHMSDGRVYEVDHPEFISCSRDGTTLTFWTMEDQRLVLLSAHHVTAIEVVNRPAVA